MPPNEEDSDFPATITVSNLLDLLFGEEVTYYYANRQHCPARLLPEYDLMKFFEKQIERAVSLGELKIKHPGNKFCWHKLNRNGVFRWIHTNGKLKWLEDQGLEIPDDVKEVVEASAKIEQKGQETQKQKPDTITKTQPISTPPLDTYAGKMKVLKDKVYKEGDKLLRSGDINTATEFVRHSKIIQAIKKSGLPDKKKPKNDTLKNNWFPEIRKNAGVKGSPGRPKNPQ